MNRIMKIGLRKEILVAAFAVLAFVTLTGFEIKPHRGVCTQRNIMFWRTDIRPTRLRDNLYLLQVYGTDLINGNTTALVGDDGVLLVDPGHPEMLDKERAALPQLRNSSLRFVIDSHAHADHACANGEAFRQGAIIIGQRNVKAAFDKNQVPRSPGDVPQLIYDDEMALQFDGEELRLIHPPKAHTEADTITVFKHDNVISTGDVFVNGRWPFMGQGSIDGFIAAEKRILSLANDETLIVPGHGPVARRADVLKSFQRMTEVRRRIAALVAKGLSEDQVSAKHPIDDLDAYVGDPSGRRQITSTAAVTRFVYESLSKKPQLRPVAGVTTATPVLKTRPTRVQMIG